MNDTLDSRFRMPTVFGPAPGPRNLPASRRHRRFDKKAVSLTISAMTDPAALSALLPQGYSIDGEPRLEIVITLLSDIGWLAGRGYDILMVRIPARWSGREEVTGHFIPVVWENMADPILTGREELGWPKIFADIRQVHDSGTRWRGCARWEGFEFFSVAAEGLTPAPAPAAPPLPMMFHRYIPRTGEWGTAEIDQMTIVEPGPPAPELKDCRIGSGYFSFHHARWEDMPTQYPIVNALADLPLRSFGPAIRLEVSGGTDVGGQRILR